MLIVCVCFRFSMWLQPAVRQPAEIEELWRVFVGVRDEWMAGLDQLHAGSDMPAMIASSSSSSAVGRRLRGGAHEQQRLLNQFAVEVCRTITYAVSRHLNLQADHTHSVSVPAYMQLNSVPDLVVQYQLMAADLSKQQAVELQCAANFDKLFAVTSGDKDNVSAEEIDWTSRFRAPEVFTSALYLTKRVQCLLSAPSQNESGH